MLLLKPIRTEAEHLEGLKAIEDRQDAEPGSPRFDEREALTILVDAYERKLVPDLQTKEPPQTPHLILAGAPEFDEVLSGLRELSADEPTNPRNDRADGEAGASGESQQPPPPPGWMSDALSSFLETAHQNQFATFARKAGWYRRIAAIDELFVRVAKDWVNPKDTIAAMLCLRCHAAYRATCGLAMAGQVAEATVMQRSCLEYAAYALHINRSPGLGRLWLDRHQDEKTFREVKKRFQIAEVRKSIAAVNRKAAERFDLLYQRTIDFGAHPNELGVLSNLQIDKQEGRHVLLQMYLQGDGLTLEHTLKNTALCGLNALEILQGVLNARFELLGVNADMQRLRQGL